VSAPAPAPEPAPPPSTNGDAAKPADPKPVDPKLLDPRYGGDPPPSKLGKFVVRYPTFISSIVIGIAGLIATTIWQYRNYHNQRENNDAQRKIAETQASNAWKIERTKILGNNMAVLAQSGSDTADARYGVLLSLTRAEIIDPELAVSYALELGKDNAEYMQTVLANTQNKEYWRLARAFTPSCEARYGRTSALDICRDRWAARSEALQQLIAEETAAAIATDPLQPGPLALLSDEKRVQKELVRLVALFSEALENLYRQRKWDDIDKVEQFSTGAHALSALVLSAAHTGELATEDEQKSLDAFHAKEAKWLDDYLVGKSCDAACKAQMIEVMLTRYEEARGDYDVAMRRLLEAPRAHSAFAVARMHARLMWCQVSVGDLAPLRDNVLVPVALDMLAKAPDPGTFNPLITLLAVVDEPPASATSALAAWSKLTSGLAKYEVFAKAFRDHRAMAARERSAPSPSQRRVDFCLATATPANAGSASAPTPPTAPAQPSAP
jgi:hypothetical protein